MSTYHCTNAQALHHMTFGQVEKAIDVMCRLVPLVTDDNALIYQATLGVMPRDLNVKDSEATSAIGRKRFLINTLNRTVRLAAKPELDKKHALAEYRTFCFHAAQLGLGDIHALINESLPQSKQWSL